MNKNCLLCGSIIPRKRLYPYTKYCSERCNKNSWNIRHKGARSYLAKNPDFWKTETGIGFKWEQYVAKKLCAEHLEFNSNGEDLRLGELKIDVKVCELYKRKMKRGKKVGKIFGIWSFARGKMKPMDYFYCVCLIKGKPVKELYIPNDKFSKSGISVGEKSKYDIYKV